MLDFGHTPALLVAQYYDRCFHCLKEWTSEATTLKKFLRFVLPELYSQFPQHFDQMLHYYWAIDPAGLQMNQNEESSCVITMWDAGIRNIFPGPVTWQERRENVEDQLILQTKDGPGFLVNSQQCPMLVRGFLGGYAYPDSSGEIQPDTLRPVKNKFSHIHDALQMGISLKDAMLTGNVQPISAPSYGGQRQSKIYSSDRMLHG